MPTPQTTRNDANTRGCHGERGRSGTKYKTDRKKGAQEAGQESSVDHAMKSSLMPGKLQKRKTLTELYVNGSFAEDREAWKKELQRHCDEVYQDPQETIEEQGKGIQNYKRNGDRHLTEDGRTAEITVDLV